MSVAGIDLGNDASCVALARKRGVDVLMNKESKRETPSAVAFGAKMRSFGGDAASGRAMNMRNTIVDIRRFLGKPFRAPDVQKDVALAPFKVVEGPRGNCAVEVDFQGETQVFSMEKVAAMVLVEMKKIAEADQGSEITDCVLACPVYATDAERAAMVDAARIAGLTPLRIVNENTATALGYGIYKTDLPEDKPVHVAIVDYGHVGIQVSVVALTRTGLRVLAHSWDVSCGGRALDWALFEMARGEFRAKTKLDVLENKRATLRLLLAVEKCKKVLTSNPLAPLSVECLMEDRDFNIMVAREQFEGLCQASFQSAEGAMRRALELSGLPAEEVAVVECVGGSSRIPAFAGAVRAVFGKDPSRTLHTKECVARGCALQCAILSPIFRVRDFDVQDSVPLPVAITYDNPEPKDGQGPVVTQTVFKRGSPFPLSVNLTLHRREPFPVRVHYAEDAELPEGYPRELGTYHVGPPIPVPEGQEKAKLKVKLGLNLHGMASVDGCAAEEVKVVQEEVPADKAEDKAGAEGGAKEGEEAAAADGAAAGAEAKKVDKTVVKKTPVPVAAEGAAGLTPAELEKAKEHEFDLALRDRVQEETNNAKNDLEAYILAMRGRLGDALAPYVTPGAAEHLMGELNKAEDWLYGDGEDTSKGAYLERLAGLRAMGDPVEARAREDAERPGAAAALEATCRQFLESAASTAPELAHIGPEDRGRVRSECEAAPVWLQEKQALQSAQPAHADPVLVCKDIAKKAETVQRVCQPILSQPPPAPAAPAPASAKEEDREAMDTEEVKPAKEGAEAMEVEEGERDAAGGATGDKMETD